MNSKPYKIIQTIYVDAGFARLLDIISGYLSRFRWYVGEDREDSLLHETAQQRWKDEKKEGKVALVLYPPAITIHFLVLESSFVFFIYDASSKRGLNLFPLYLMKFA